ncbi:MAG: epimerase [Capnocytophaga sp.]|nr:epimerase [Capnocytophaga sp.]
MKIGIIGGGWLGTRLGTHLASYHSIYATTTSQEKQKELEKSYFHSFLVDFDKFNNQKWEILAELDCIIITIPFGKHLSKPIFENRLKNLCFFIENFKKQLFFTSSVGIYPQINAEIDETCPPTLLQNELLQSENFLKKNFPQLNILRLGGLMGDNRIFSKYNVSETHLVVNHVHYQDICFIIEKMITLNLHSKIYNIVAPQHPTKQQVINFQKRISCQDTNISPQGKIVSSQKVINELGYTFVHPNPILF